MVLSDALQNQKNFLPPELVEAEKIYQNLTLSEREAWWKELHTFFLKAPLSADRKFWYSYFRWYTDLTWKNLFSQDNDIVSSVVFPRQLVMAILLGFDPLHELLVFLNSNAFDRTTMPDFYRTVRDGVLKTGAIVGIAKGREVTGAELVKELTAINQSRDTLRLAEFSTRLKEVLFPKNDELATIYLAAVPDEATTTYLDILSFFIGVEGGGIWEMVQSAFHPELTDAIIRADMEALQPKAVIRARSSSPDSIVQPPVVSSAVSSNTLRRSLETTASSATEMATPSTVVVDQAAVVKRPTNAEIKAMVEALIPPNEGSEEVRLPKILNVLETLAVRYGDENIRELYFFNTEQGVFEWMV